MTGKKAGQQIGSKRKERLKEEGINEKWKNTNYKEKLVVWLKESSAFGETGGLGGEHVRGNSSSPAHLSLSFSISLFFWEISLDATRHVSPIDTFYWGLSAVWLLLCVLLPWRSDGVL